MPSRKLFVLFVCRHNTGRSQMAEAYLRHFADDAVDVVSAGTAAADAPNAGVVAAMTCIRTFSETNKEKRLTGWAVPLRARMHGIGHWLKVREGAA